MSLQKETPRRQGEVQILFPLDRKEFCTPLRQNIQDQKSTELYVNFQCAFFAWEATPILENEIAKNAAFASFEAEFLGAGGENV